MQSHPFLLPPHLQWPGSLLDLKESLILWQWHLALHSTQQWNFNGHLRWLLHKKLWPDDCSTVVIIKCQASWEHLVVSFAKCSLDANAFLWRTSWLMTLHLLLLSLTLARPHSFRSILIISDCTGTWKTSVWSTNPQHSLKMQTSRHPQDH